ncbi:bifunctional aminoglycoside phosphotransferase/ATP-binding protein [Pseudomonas sp. N040]|uniref:bifunctional aminoglycoside phosphotransferase/ATP-binding protein n=1 Tax=Pseudomonas sp. N040 TaxID=2785325 RepID=UPI0018A27092|nr:bifunctional aminoglycoside phosphotransferase/ATP-binding protein [Pseudomonas sp. N040]MBF7730434.1 AAA family ATPase [Pseudomonas sp. N040]MBW7014077.1 AAA family ATPase [Pseudomonas sp. N040]
MSQQLIDALQNPALYPHPVDGFQLIETHISWVLLTGPYAYKIKKPVNFGFLDFTTLEARRHFCNEELQLNQRLTQGLYLQVLPITGSVATPQLGGDGAVIEYALQMRQFPQSQLLTNVLARGELLPSHIDDLARQIATFHQQTPRVPLEHPLGSAEAVMAPVRQNFEQARAMLSDKSDLEQLTALEDWAEITFARLRPLLEQRKAEGFIRECHGDIHLGNATLLDGRVALFDCIEFNEPFRLIDIVSDAAFLAMDLEDRGLHALSRRFVSQWLEHTGDYAGVELLNFYKAYRAMVRAKVSLFSLAHQSSTEGRATTLRQYRSYANLAESYSSIPAPFLAITHGVSAVGKSHVAMRLVEELGAIRLRSDVERKRLFGEQAGAATGQLDVGIYTADASAATYRRLHELAAGILHSGRPVVIDATYLKQVQRDAAWQVAEAAALPFLILDCRAPDTVIAQWLAQRTAAGGDPSDATMAVIQAQQTSREALSSAELAHCKTIDTHDRASLDSLVSRIRQHLGGH